MEETVGTSVEQVPAETHKQSVTAVTEGSKKDLGGTFSCSSCTLKEHFDFKGTKPPFARQITYIEDSYVMKDPFSLPNKGEVLVLGGDCSICKKAVCLGCSIFYGKRFCVKCASDNIHSLPSQVHSKLKSLQKDTDS